MESLLTLEALDKITSAVVLMLVALAVISDKLIWHKRFDAVEKQRARWEKIALEALTAGAQAGVKAAEVTVDVVSAMPDPAKRVPPTTRTGEGT